ncbi:hypothetical protein E2C01_005916 [Portunus trituberculatus]|uniref:Uncharacterized protein n=1 Tax=Portunus trituberculatus TaxID=210409 RepID=A0A5B7CVP8_PORTR|nr:hypothetical protein [Portunus trituberculatus]
MVVAVTIIYLQDTLGAEDVYRKSHVNLCCQSVYSLSTSIPNTWARSGADTAHSSRSDVYVRADVQTDIFSKTFFLLSSSRVM